MGRLTVRRGASAGLPWYRFSRRRLYCPACKVELRARATPTGYLLQFLMLQILGSGVLLISAGDTGGRQFATVVLVLAAVAITAVACSRYGFRYELASLGEVPARRSRSR